MMKTIEHMQKDGTENVLYRAYLFKVRVAHGSSTGCTPAAFGPLDGSRESYFVRVIVYIYLDALVWT